MEVLLTVVLLQVIDWLTGLKRLNAFMSEIRFNYDSLYANLCTWFTLLIFLFCFYILCINLPFFYIFLFQHLIIFQIKNKGSTWTHFCCLPYMKKKWVMILSISIQLFCWMFGKRNLELPFLSVPQHHTSSVLTCALIIAFDPVLLLKRVWRLLYVHLKNNMLLSFLILFFLCEITGKDMIINVMTESWV